MLNNEMIWSFSSPASCYLNDIYFVFDCFNVILNVFISLKSQSYKERGRRDTQKLIDISIYMCTIIHVLYKFNPDVVDKKVPT